MSNVRINPDAFKTGREVIRHKIPYGTSIFRILPPTEKSPNGYPYQRWEITWGLLDPTKGTKRPYASSKMAEGKCPVREYWNLLDKKTKERELKLKQEGKTEEEVKTILRPMYDTLRNLRLKIVYVYNVADQSGRVGLLELSPEPQGQTKEVMGEYYHSLGMDPTSLNNAPNDMGIWLEIKKEGKGLDTTYTVTKRVTMSKDPVTGRAVYMDDNTALPKDVVDNYEKLAYDLQSCYQMLTYDQLKEILVFNISNWVKENPELAIEGFDTSFVAPVVTSVSQTVTPTTSTISTTNSTISGNSTITNREISATNDAEFDAMAREILGGTTAQK